MIPIIMEAFPIVRFIVARKRQILLVSIAAPTIRHSTIDNQIRSGIKNGPNEDTIRDRKDNVCAAGAIFSFGPKSERSGGRRVRWQVGVDETGEWVVDQGLADIGRRRSSAPDAGTAHKRHSALANRLG